MVRSIGLLLVVASLAGCAVNPVTGERDFMVVSQAQELALGEQNYLPMQQAQGGVYDVDPELSAYVRGVGQKLAAVADNPLPYEFVVLNNSTPNAWALPGGKIAINRGLLTELNSEAELAAVLGHEIVHAAARHSAQQMSRGMVLQGLVFATAIATDDSDYGNMAVGAATVGAQLISARYGQGAELESDEYGMRYMSNAGYDPQGAVTLQETFVRLSEGRRADWLSGLFASHPPSQARVEANVRTAASLPGGGRVGADEYRAALSATMQAKPAYDAYDAGRKALADKDTNQALVLANRAIDLYPDEAHFYALRGDIRFVTQQYDMAITNFDTAIRRRDDFFYYHLQRGLAKRERRDFDGAATDLENSLALLPTAPAHFALGNIAEQRGQANKAISHYRVVAESGGDYGKAARARLVRLDLPGNPGAYLPRRCDADQYDNLVVSIRNDTDWHVTDVVITIQLRDAGVPREVRQTLRGRVAPGQIVSASTGLGPYGGGSCPATVVSARILE